MFDIKSFYEAKSVNDAVRALSEDENALLISGGTDVLIRLREGKDAGASLVSIHNIPELKEIREDENGTLIIGAGASFSDITNNPIVKKNINVLGEAADTVGGPQIRNMGTIGGNICNASPSADSLPSLYAMDAVLRLKSKDSQRDIKIKDFITGVSKTTIKDDEILTHVIIPKKNYEYSFYRKIGTRKANALSKLAMCALALKENDKYRFKISFCTLGVTVTRDESIEEKFASSNIDDWKNNINSIQEAYAAIMKPRDSARSTALYRKQCALNLIKYFVEDICKK